MSFNCLIFKNFCIESEIVLLIIGFYLIGLLIINMFFVNWLFKFFWIMFIIFGIFFVNGLLKIINLGVYNMIVLLILIDK